MPPRKLEFKIKSTVFDDLIGIQNKLPAHATRENVKGGQGQSYDHPAGMALLGMKDEEVDTVIALRMSGGCWDAPNVNYDDMDKAFQKLIKEDRICAGMALIRHPTWSRNAGEDQGKMPQHLKYQLHGLRNSFTDITKTAWIVLHNDYFRLYRPTKSEDGRVGCKEIPANSLFSEEDKKSELIASKIKRDNEKAARKLAAKKAKEEAKARWLEEQKKRIEEAEEKERKAAEKTKKKADELSASLKTGDKDIIDIGGGMVFMKDKKGQYVLWQTTR